MGKDGQDTFQESVAISYKTKHTFTIQSSNDTPWHLLKRGKNLGPHKNLHNKVFECSENTADIIMVNTCQYTFI